MCADDNNLSTGDKFLYRTNNSSFSTTMKNKTGKKDYLLILSRTAICRNYNSVNIMYNFRCNKFQNK